MKDHKTGLDLATMAIYVVSFIVFMIVAKISWRAVFFSARLIIARHRATHGEDEMTRWFGRASIAFCAHIIAYRRRGALTPGGFLAKRVVGAARSACKVALRCEDLTEPQADHWMTDITGEALPRRKSRENDNSQRRGETKCEAPRRSNSGRAQNRRDLRPRSPQMEVVLRPSRREEVSSERGGSEMAAPFQPVRRERPTVGSVDVADEPRESGDLLIVEPPELREIPPPDGMPEFLEEIDHGEVVSMLVEDHDQEIHSRLAV